MSDWKQAIGGKVADSFVAENLDVSKEYVLELAETSYQENVTGNFKGEPTVNDIFTTVWQVEGHKTKVWQKFNLPIGYLAGAAGPNEKSNVVKFAKRFKPVPKDQPFLLVDHFQDHMRIRVYLKRQEKSEYYNMDLDTVGPFFQAAPVVSASAERIAAMKKILDMYYPVREEARKVYLQLPGGNEAEFSMLWDMVQADHAMSERRKAAGAAPVIDADKAQAQAYGKTV